MLQQHHESSSSRRSLGFKNINQIKLIFPFVNLLNLLNSAKVTDKIYGA